MLVKTSAKKQLYKKSFFPSCSFSWNNILNASERQTKSLLSFKFEILKYSSIQKKVKNYYISFTNEIKHINQLRVGLSPLNEHKFNHKFANTTSPLCFCKKSTEDILHFLRYCPLRVSQKRKLYRDILRDTNVNLLLVPETDFVRLLLYGDSNFTDEINNKLLKHCSDFIEATQRFNFV